MIYTSHELVRNKCSLFFGTFLILFLGISAFSQSGSGGGVVNTPLPQTAPAPGILFRESFGWGPQGLRPTGNNGTLTDTVAVANLNDFWVEYLGSSNRRWIAPTANSGWFFCGAEENPFELPSPLQTVNGVFNNGCVTTGYDGNGAYPSAIMPLPGGINTPFEVSLDGFAIPQGDSYLSIGLTNSNTTSGNLLIFGSVVLTIRNQFPNSLSTLLFDLRVNGIGGQVLAHGISVGNLYRNHLKIRYNPRTKTVGAQLNDAVIDPVPVNFSTPKYAGFEGLGLVDNFVIKAL